MRESIRSSSNPFASDSPKTHCVPSLVCPKTPCVCLFAVNLLAFAFLLLNSLRFHLSILLVIADSQICPQHLLVHSCLEHFTLAHSMGFRERDEGTYSLVVQIPLRPIPLKPTAFPHLFALKLLALLICCKSSRVCFLRLNSLRFPSFNITRVC